MTADTTKPITMTPEQEAEIRGLDWMPSMVASLITELDATRARVEAAEARARELGWSVDDFLDPARSHVTEPEEYDERQHRFREALKHAAGDRARGGARRVAKDLGISEAQVSRILSGERRASDTVMRRAAETLGIGIEANSDVPSVVLVDLQPRYGESIGATQAVLVVAHIVFLTNDGVVRMADGSGVSVTTESMQRVAKALGRVTILPMQGGRS